MRRRTPTGLFAATAALLAGCFGSPEEGARTPFSAGGHTPAGEPEEVVSWDDARNVWVDFERLRGWKAAADGADVQLTRVFDERLQHFSACLTSTQTEAIARVWLRPPQPIEIPEPFDAVEADVRASLSSNAAPSVARPQVAVILQDGRGRTWREPLGPIPSEIWRLAHRSCALTGSPDAGGTVRLVAIEVRDWQQPSRETICVSRLCAYLEHRGILDANWLPTPHGRYHSPGWRVLHGDPPETPPVLPLPAASPTAAWTASLVEAGNDRFEFRLQQEGADLRYILRADDPWCEVAIGFNGHPVARWAGWQAGAADGAGLGALLSVRVEGGQVLQLEYASGFRCRMRLDPPWLAMELDDPGRRIERVEAGGWILPEPPRRITLPLFGPPDGGAPAIWQWFAGPEDGGQPLYGCVWMSPWSSGASRLTFPPAAATAGDPAAAAIYQRDTRNRLPPLREELRIGVSPSLEDLLPRSPYGRCAKGDVLRQRLWSDAAPEAAHATDAGCDVAWDILGIRTRTPVPSPPPVSERLCWLAGDAIAPTYPGWSRDVLRRDSGGQWIAGGRADRVCLKLPVLAAWHRVALESTLRPHWLRSEAVVATPLADWPPWAYTDFDARTPEAGSFAGAYRALGRMFRAVSAQADSPVLGSADHAWLYAGWLDGWVPGPTSPISPSEPVQPLYALRILQPASLGIGLGPADDWLLHGAPEAKEERFYRWLAVHLAYGCALRIPDPGTDPARAIRAAALLRGIQNRALHEAPAVIAWSDGARLHTPSEALATGVWKDGRLYLRYPNGLELWIYTGSGADWTVSVGPTEWRIPPSGWIASDGACLALSARLGVNRIDLVHGPSYLYMDGHGQETALMGLACAQAALIRRPSDERGGVMDVVFPTTAARVGFGLESRPRGQQPLGGQCWRSDGRETARPRWYRDEEDDRIWIEPPPDARRMRVEWGA